MNLKAEHIELSFGGKKILKDVSLEVSGREFVGIIGPNGSGKSTLLKCIYRTLKPDSGEIFLDGRNLRTMNFRESARRLAVVAQHNYYNFEFTVNEVVLMGRSPHKKSLERETAEDYAIVRESLSAVGMLEFAGRNFSTLSGGEQQRVILARALAQRTPCLILDEPTNHLDITHQLQLLQIVKSRKAAVLSAIHDLNLAAMYCDRLYVLQGGKIAASGPPEEVLTPSFIREIYGVKAELARDKNGRSHILFLDY